MIIGACGFGSTGSSVISDYLSEYRDDNIQVLDNIEFTWVSDPDSLIDLEYHVFHPHNRTRDSIIAIDRYIAHMEQCKKHYQKCGSIDAKELERTTKEFIDSITDVKWYWYNSQDKLGFFSRLLKVSLLQARLIPFIERKVGHRIKCYPMVEVSLSSKPDCFFANARKHVEELLSLFGADLNKTIVLDQPFSGNNPQACFPYFEDPRAIVVDRDPRDNYVFAKTRLLGVSHFMAVDNVYDYIKYFKAIRENQPYKEHNDNVLVIQFEELVYDYDCATQKLRNFLGLGDNPNPKSVFDPSLSVNNTQVWKRFPQYKNDIEIIERELSDYLFDFSKYGDVSPNGEMFYGKSPLHK